MDRTGPIAVTGAAGKLGTEVVRQLRAAGWRVVAADRTSSADQEGVRAVAVDLTDADAVHDMLAGCHGLIHLAAYPTPYAASAAEVFGNNTRATFNVLLAATEHGIGNAVIASSVCAYGMPYAPVAFAPDYVPVDEDHPLSPRDPYGLSKLVDEQTAATFARAAGISVVALRLHWVSTEREQRERAAELAHDPGRGVTEMWGYVDVRDAARACLLGLAVRRPGVHPVVVAAPDSVSATPTRELLSRFHPEVPVAESLDGHDGAWSTARARELLGFTAEYSWRHA